MAKVKDPTSSGIRVDISQAPAGPSVTPTKISITEKTIDDGFSRAASGLLGYKSSRLVSGAIKLFSDGIILPSNLTDPKDPRNDPKYFRLLAAVLGLDDLESYYHSLEEGQQQEDYLAHKTQLREKRWAKIEGEKEEKRRKKEEEGEEEEGA